jgi:hypothetical protein
VLLDYGQKITWLEEQSELQRKQLVLVKFTTKWSNWTRNEMFNSYKAHNRMKHWNMKWRAWLLWRSQQKEEEGQTSSKERIV